MKVEKILEQRVQSAAETQAMAVDFAKQLQSGDLLAFYGNLGSGKTFFVQALCGYWQTTPAPSSPTFTIVNEYYTSKGLPIYHFDFYRIEHDAELMNLGLDDYFYSDSICLIEWADKIEKHLPLPRYQIELNLVAENANMRDISISRLSR